LFADDADAEGEGSMPTDIVMHKMPIVSTFDPPPGWRVERVIGPCWGITVRSRSVVGTACAGCQTFFGGEITMLTELANNSRNEAMTRLEQHAQVMGANCVLAMRFDSSELMQNTNEIVAYGTAVVIYPEQAAAQVATQAAPQVAQAPAAPAPAAPAPAAPAPAAPAAPMTPPAAPPTAPPVPPTP
jgi:uncharacterized protein YbjQ (UPF0145 family)